jgi:hypothetical protein
MGLLSGLKTFYVYGLMDGASNQIFYIGKGQNDRVFHHLKEVKRGVIETAKHQLIAQIENTGNVVKQTVIGRFDSEKEAFAVECTLIHWVYGVSNLTNIAGGHGANTVRSINNLCHAVQLEENSKCLYYVYVLMDSVDNRVFYVGKGRGNRCYQHLKEVEKGLVTSLKQQKILSIIESGSQVTPLIIGRFSSEEEALAVESVLIHWVYGLEFLTNNTSGHGVSTVRPKGHYEVLQGVDEPELNYCTRTKENRERNDVIPYLNELKFLIESNCDVKFDEIHTGNDRHTYLVKFIKGVRLTVCCHHNAKKSAAVTIESIDTKAHNKERVRYICNNSNLEFKDNGRYGKIMPAGMHSDPQIILAKFKEMLSEIERVEI